jgi:hypothetical protein
MSSINYYKKEISSDELGNKVFEIINVDTEELIGYDYQYVEVEE